MGVKRRIHRNHGNTLQAVVKEGLSLVVFGDWFDSHVLKEIGFFDSNTQRQLTAWTGGANVPELNKLLGPFGISLSTDMACFFARCNEPAGKNVLVLGSG